MVKRSSFPVLTSVSVAVNTRKNTAARKNCSAGSGCAGVVTDGGFRDTPELRKLLFPAYHNRPAAPTNLTLHQAIEINGPIGCGDVPVFPGDVLVGDAEGAVVVPAHLADEIADETLEMTAFEDFVTEEVLKGRSILGLYPATEEQTCKDFEAWRKTNKR